MIEEMDGQFNLFDQDIWCGKTSPEPSVPMTEKISASCLKRRQESQIPLPLFLDLRESRIGLLPDAFWEMGGALLGDYTMLSFGESPKDAVESLLSQILTDNPHPKYSLSATACKGILNRAEKRGKELPPLLREALIHQAAQSGGISTPTLISGQYKQAGNTQDGLTVVQGFDAYNQSATGEKAKPLTNKATDSDHIPIVSYGFDQGATRDVGRAFYEEPMMVTFRKQGHPQTSNDGQGCEETKTNDTLNAFDNGENRTPTLVLENHPNDSRMKIKDDNVFQTLSSRMGTGGGNTPMLLENVIVRRLTPLECERLQGFPDDWTDIGDWVDSQGKKHKGDSDSPRYKALGNSIALPFWQWMAERMVQYIDDEPTMASLFDGIGGFPLVYSRAGCKPIWASEIEEFPIAVTKLRFDNK